MESRIVVTYKRKRLFSRSDHSHINIHSDAPSEISESKNLANANKNEEPNTESRLQNNDKEFEIRHEHVEGKDGESLAQYENCECATKRQKLCSGCTKQQDSSDSQKILLEESREESCQIDSATRSHAEEKLTDNQSQLNAFVKSGSEDENKSKETFSDELHKDQNSNLNAENSKMGSTLITFCRRSKRNRAIAAPDVASRSDNDEKDSRANKSSLQGQVCNNVEDSYQVNQLDVNSQNLSIQVINTEKTPSDVSENKDSPSSLDLYISPPGARDFDCNLPLEGGSDENRLSGPLEVNENVPTLQLQSTENGSPMVPIGDKGKSPIDPSPVLTGTSSKNDYLQLFPENRTNHALGLANDPQKANFLTGPQESYPSSAQSSRFNGFFWQSEPKLNTNHPCYSASYMWPNINFPSQEAFEEFLHSSPNPFTGLTLNRARVNGATYSNKFEYRPTSWFQEELDCLWIGVRRHGKGNWDAILRDPRLTFLQSKTTRDLAERWQEEQYKLVYGGPVSQVKYPGPPDFTSIHTNGLLQKAVTHQGPSLCSCGHLKCNWGPFRPAENNIMAQGRSSCPKGSLPHWLREAVETPPRQWGPSQGQWGPSQGQWGPSAQRRKNETRFVRRGNGEVNDRRVDRHEDLIVISSDASSEETISDDLGAKGLDSS